MLMTTAALGRRKFLLGSAATVAVASVGLDTRSAAAARVDAYPFQLGVASGDPLPDAVVLWTRLVRDLLDPASMGSVPIAVQWVVAEDAACRRVVRSGTATAHPALAHSVHVDVRGLRPDRVYHYRFKAGAYASEVGTTRTAPALDAAVSTLKVGVVNCQDWQNGYWPAYDHLAEEDLDVVLHLGDYIYEYDPASVYPDRLHNPPETLGLQQLLTLTDYRNRQALYKTDPAIQRAHGRFPWVLTWDDHEVENNYAGLVDEIDDTGEMYQDPVEFAAQRTNSYQAYYEHMPIRPKVRLGSPDYKIYRSFDYGDLLRVAVLDTRQYRTDQPGGFSTDFGDEQAGRANVDGTMTGAEQEAWLQSQLDSSPALWNAIAQQTLMTRVRFPNVDPTVPLPFIANLDQWDGYFPQRQRIVDFLDQAAVSNPVVLAGDIHSSWFSDINLDPDDPESKTVAAEFAATSISSDFPIDYDALIKAFNPVENPQVKYFDGSRRGYLRMTIDRSQWLTEARTVSTIAEREAPVETTAGYVTLAGDPGVLPA